MLRRLISVFGEAPLCNKRPDRAMHIGDFCFPLCYRCMMLFVGIVIGCIIFSYLKESKKYVYKFKHLIFGCVLILPTFLDGLIQTLSIYESTNLIRSVTGVIAGIGFGLIIIIFQQIMQMLFLKFKK